MNGIAVWDGTDWHAMGNGIAKETDPGSRYPSVWAIAFGPDSTMYIGGDFTEIDGVSAVGIAKWQEGAWSAMASSLGGPLCFDVPVDDVYAIEIDDSGRVYVGGNFVEIEGIVANGISMWDDQSWKSLGSGITDGGSCRSINAIEIYEEDIYAGGSFTQIDSLDTRSIAKWTGSDWIELDGGIQGGVSTISKNTNGLIFGGNFSNAGVLTTNDVAYWTPEGWQALSGGMTESISINASATFGNKIYVGGTGVMEAGGIPSFGIALWQSTESVNLEVLEKSRNHRYSFYPNPFSGKLNIKAEGEIGFTEQIYLHVYNVLGQKVDYLTISAPGLNQFTWDGDKVSDGIYFIKILSGENQETAVVFRKAG